MFSSFVSENWISHSTSKEGNQNYLLLHAKHDNKRVSTSHCLQKHWSSTFTVGSWTLFFEKVCKDVPEGEKKNLYEFKKEKAYETTLSSTLVIFWQEPFFFLHLFNEKWRLSDSSDEKFLHTPVWIQSTAAGQTHNWCSAVSSSGCEMDFEKKKKDSHSACSVITQMMRRWDVKHTERVCTWTWDHNMETSADMKL